MQRYLEPLSAGVLLLALGHVAPAHATEPGRVEFIWDAPAACPTEAEVSSRVETLLGTPLSEATNRRVSVIARVREEGDGWNMRLFTVTPEGTRERSLDHERCDLLAEATAVVVALAIDPAAAGSLQADDDALSLVVDADVDAHADVDADTDADADEDVDVDVDVDADADADPDPVPSSDEPREAANEREIFGLVGLGGAVGWGALPRTAGGLAARIGVGWTHLRVEAVGRYWFRRDVRLQAPETSGADIEMWSFGPRVCGVPIAPPIEIPICAGVEAGQMIARAVQLEQPRTVTAAWAAATLTAGIAWAPVRMFALRLDAEAFLALRRPAFDVEGGEGVLHRARAGGIRGILGFEVRFP